MQNNPIPPSGDSGTAPNLALPSSTLPPITNPNPLIDPTNPSGIIPSTGNSTYDIDLAQFEGSGQPWRRPGSDIQDWFNYGFDEVSYPKFLRYRQEMEAGKNALVSWRASHRCSGSMRTGTDSQMQLPMGAMTPEVAQLLHLPNPMMAMNQINQMNQMGQMGGMNHQMGMGNMGQMGNMGGFNPQQLQAMQQQIAAMEGMMQPGMNGPGPNQVQIQGQGQAQGLGMGGGQQMAQRQGEPAVHLLAVIADLQHPSVPVRPRFRLKEKVKRSSRRKERTM